ncbi:MAG: DUF1552 domain-containing protein [Saprospiraceae bacterium]|nr:DUF1552 domain-containing protein [Saprospiraceae bacterium]
MNQRQKTSRRAVLKGLGASLALPFLPSLMPKGLLAQSAGATHQAPQRFAALFMPNGVHPGKWSPTKLGRDFELSPILQPLAKVQDKMLVLGGLSNKHSYRTVEGHYTKTGNFLTSMRVSRTVDADVNAGGISVDQVLAKHLGKHSVFPSLQYGLDRMKSGVCKSTGITRLYGSTISWESGRQPCSREIDPRMAFDRLFRDFVPGKKPLPHDPYKQSVLDIVMNDAKRLEKRIGVEDRNKLNEYLTSVRTIEKRLDNQASLKDFEARITPDVRKELQRMDIRIDEWAEFTEGVDITDKARLMVDIIVLAFWSDISRVATYMLGNSASGRNFSFLDGVNDSHHAISHHKYDPRQMAQYEIINRWHIEQYAYLLERLDSIKEGDGTLLDNSMILFGSGLRDGMRHSPKDLPIVVGGSGGGRLHTGSNVRYDADTPLANLYQTMLAATGSEVQGFGDSTGTLSDLLV